MPEPPEPPKISLQFRVGDFRKPDERQIMVEIVQEPGEPPPKDAPRVRAIGCFDPSFGRSHQPATFDKHRDAPNLVPVDGNPDVVHAGPLERQGANVEQHIHVTHGETDVFLWDSPEHLTIRIVNYQRTRARLAVDPGEPSGDADRIE